jgi:hypothetical protein
MHTAHRWPVWPGRQLWPIGVVAFSLGTSRRHMPTVQGKNSGYSPSGRQWSASAYMRVSPSGAQPPAGTAAQYRLPFTPLWSFQVSALHRHSASDTAPRWNVRLDSARLRQRAAAQSAAGA